MPPLYIETTSQQSGVSDDLIKCDSDRSWMSNKVNNNEEEGLPANKANKGNAKVLLAEWLKKDRKRLTFDTKVKVRKVSSHRSYSDEERLALWYSNEETKQIRASAVATVKRMMKKEDVDADEDDCSRGLEYKSPKKNKKRQAKKTTIIWRVLGMQENMMDEGHIDRQALADLYYAASKDCSFEAYVRGMRDEYEAWGPSQD